MSTKLTITDLDVILESLAYSKKAYTEYQDYPSNDFRQKQIDKVEQVEMKIKVMKSQLN
tara:strand:+ start:520 stop:696 length:177 start_codon:yes stop_codon:yes gene_type:complete